MLKRDKNYVERAIELYIRDNIILVNTLNENTVVRTAQSVKNIKEDIMSKIYKKSILPWRNESKRTISAYLRLMETVVLVHKD